MVEAWSCDTTGATATPHRFRAGPAVCVVVSQLRLSPLGLEPMGGAVPPEPLPYVNWFWKDWRASTARALMSPLARGVYRELLDAHYAFDDCSVPDDDAELAALAGVTPEQWSEVREVVLRWIPKWKDGKRRNTRAYEDWKKGVKARRDKAKAGRASGKARRKAARTAIEQRSSSGATEGDASLNSYTPTPTYTPTKGEKTPPAPPATKRKHSPQEQLARDLARLLGSTLNPCRKQIQALVASGMTLEEIRPHLGNAAPGIAPWDWTKAVRGGGSSVIKPGKIDWAERARRNHEAS